jgi:methanogenic corrinoid protein MtbC1/DNA-binding XRE family transcriptional regulator
MKHRKIEELKNIQNEYINDIVEGNNSKINQAIEQMIKDGWNISDIYNHIFIPAQHQIGELWKQGKINIAQEHLATEITFQQMEKVRAAFTPSTRLAYKAVVSSIEGDRHAIGAKMVADLFYINGWQVDFLGANIPKHDLVEFICERRPEIVGLSVTLNKNLIHVTQIIKMIRSLSPNSKILVGGRAITKDTKDNVDADIIADNAFDGVEKALQNLGTQREQNRLEDYLKMLGRQIQQLRKSKNWSQQKLADIAQLERTYISTVERGKQNLTLGALIKLANALGTPLEELLIEKSSSMLENRSN